MEQQNEEEVVTMKKIIQLSGEGPALLHVVTKKGSYHEVWKEQNKTAGEEWMYPCQNAGSVDMGPIPTILVNSDSKPLMVTLGATGRVLDGFHLGQDNILIPPNRLPGEAPRLMREYFGEVMPPEVQYMWWDDRIVELPAPPLYGMMGDKNMIWPLMVVTANPRKCLVIDAFGRLRRVAFGKQDDYMQFVTNGVAKWHAVSPDKVELYMNKKLVSPLAEDGTSNKMWDVTSLFQHNGFLPVLECRIKN